MTPAEILRQMRQDNRDPLNALEACIRALRSYQHGNASPYLAEEVVDYADKVLTAARRSAVIERSLAAEKAAKQAKLSEAAQRGVATRKRNELHAGERGQR